MAILIIILYSIISKQYPKSEYKFGILLIVALGVYLVYTETQVGEKIYNFSQGN